MNRSMLNLALAGLLVVTVMLNIVAFAPKALLNFDHRHGRPTRSFV